VSCETRSKFEHSRFIVLELKCRIAFAFEHCVL